MVAKLCFCHEQGRLVMPMTNHVDGPKIAVDPKIFAEGFAGLEKVCDNMTTQKGRYTNSDVLHAQDPVTK